MPYCHSSCRFHSVLNVKENSMSTDFLLERSTGLAGFGAGVRELGNGKEWEIVSHPKAAVSNIPEVARTQLSFPHCPCTTGLAGISCLKAKRAQGLPVCKSLERRGLCSPGLAPGFLLCCCLPCSAFSILSKEQPWPQATSQGPLGDAKSLHCPLFC